MTPCYGPPDAAPPAAPPPQAACGRVTFASFNNHAKVSDRAITVWADVLKAVPSSRVLIKSRAMCDPSTRRRTLERLSACGLDAGRVDLRRYVRAFDEHMAAYRCVDVALDTFPYNGTTTTCEALWMGVPVVTLAGQTHASRVGASILRRVGLEDLVARSPDQFVRIAASLAGDPGRLRQLRATMRERLRDSSLLDAAGFTHRLEQAFQSAWSRWCRSCRRDAPGDPVR